MESESKLLGNIYGDKTGTGYAGNVWDKNGLAPTLMTMQGGNRQPMIVETVKMPKVLGGLGEKKSNGGQQYFQQDRVYSSDGLAMCLPAQIPGGSYRYLIVEKADNMKQIDKKWIFNVDGEDYYIRVRKLTPKECFRLMGFNDEEADKAASVNSNTQLYKQIGNSICVNVIESIFAELFKDEIEELWNE